MIDYFAMFNNPYIYLILHSIKEDLSRHAPTITSKVSVKNKKKKETVPLAVQTFVYLI